MVLAHTFYFPFKFRSFFNLPRFVFLGKFLFQNRSLPVICLLKISDDSLILSLHIIVFRNPFFIFLLPLLFFLIVPVDRFLLLFLIVELHHNLLLSQILLHPLNLEFQISLQYFELLFFVFAFRTYRTHIEL